MPTTMDQRAKFRELRKSGIPREEAMKQAYGDLVKPVVNAPMAGVAPPIIPEPIAPITPEPIAPVTPQPEAHTGDTVIGANGDKFTQMNNKDMTTTPVAPPQIVNQTPVQPVAPVAPTSPNPTKADIPVDYNASAGRENEIQTNVSNITKANPTLLKDRNAYNQAFGYETADPGKRAMLDASFTSGNTPLNANDAYNAIVTKASIPPEQMTTLAYKIAQNRYSRVNMYASKTPAQLSQDMAQARIIEGSQTWEDLKSMNPKLAQDATNLRIVNNTPTNIFTEVKNKKGEVISRENNLVKTFKEQYEEDFGDLIEMMNNIYKPDTAQQIRDAIYTPDVRKAEEKATAIELEMDELEKNIANIDKVVESEFVGTGASGERIKLEKIARKEKLQNEYNAKLDSYKTYANKANNLIKQNSSVYTTARGQLEKVAGVVNSSITKAFDTRISNQSTIEQNQALFDQKLAQESQVASDPIQAVKSVIKTFSDMGIVADRSESDMIADVQSKMAQGMTLGEATSELQKAFKSKPEYKLAMETKQGAGVSYQTFGDKVYKKMPNGDLVLTNIDANKAGADFEFKEIGGKTYKINKATGGYEIFDPMTMNGGGDLRYLASQFPGQAWAKNNNPAGITWNANFDKGTGTAKLLTDAGIQFSKGTERPASEGGNYVTFPTIEDGLKAQRIIMSQTYGNMSVGGMLTKWVGTSEGPNYAKQVAGNAGIDVNAKVSSLSEDQLGALQMAKIQKESPGLGKLLSQGVQGGSGGAGTVGKQYTDNDIALLGAVEKLDKQGKATLAENGYTEKEWANYKAGLLPPTPGQKTQAQSVVTQIDDMLTGDALSDAVGTAKTPGFVPGTQRKDFEALFATFRDNLAMSNIDKLKGAMSDKDIEFLRNTASSLNLDMSETEFKKRLTELKEKYARIVASNPVNQAQPSKATKISDNDLAELSKIFN